MYAVQKLQKLATVKRRIFGKDPFWPHNLGIFENSMKAGFQVVIVQLKWLQTLDKIYDVIPETTVCIYVTFTKTFNFSAIFKIVFSWKGSGHTSVDSRYFYMSCY